MSAEDGARRGPLSRYYSRRRTAFCGDYCPYSPHLVRRIRLQTRKLGAIISAYNAEITVYIHERQDWPQFAWDSGRLANRLAEVRHRQGRLLGRMEALGFNLRAEATLQSLTEEVVKS